MILGFGNFRTDRGIFCGLSRTEVLIALTIGSVAMLWAAFCTSSGIPPELWDETAAAVGLRPPQSPCPGLWRLGVGFLTETFGLNSTLTILRGLGLVTSFFFGALSYLTLRDSLEFASAPHISHPLWRAVLPRTVVSLVSLLLATSVPAGRIAKFFGPETMLAFFAIAVLFLMRRFLRSGGTWALYLAVAIVGIATAETPLGFVLFLFILVKTLIFMARPYNPDLPFCNPALYQSIRWHLTGLFFWCFVMTLGFNAWWFYQHGGWTVCGWTSIIDAFVETIVAYGRVLVAYSSLGGWCAGLFVCGASFVVARKLFVECLQLDKPLPFVPGLAYLLLSVVAYSQFIAVPSCWFWSAFEVRSPMLSLAFLYLAAGSLVTSLSVWAIDMYCRNERMVWLFTFPEALEMIDYNPRYRKFAEFLRVKARWMRVVVPKVSFAVVVLGALPFFRDRKLMAATDLVAEGVRLATDELKGVRWVFTDGRFDAALELEAMRRGDRLTALSLLAPRGRWTSALNHRDVADDEDRLLLDGAAETLNCWILSKPERMDESALQLGVEMFAHAKKQDPRYLGFAARTSVSEEEVARAHVAAEELEKRILAFYEDYETSKTYDELTGELVNALQWRISRLLRFRAAFARRDGDLATANALELRGDALDDKNEELKSLVRKLDWIAAKKGETLTPREGLKVALARPDFLLASCYAIPILRAHPEDAEANFAMAMRSLIERDWADAERYFRVVLKSRPKEVAVINNLAIVCFRQGKTDEALRLVLEAQKLAPSSEAVADTLKTIRRAQSRVDAPAVSE